ncbi:MAG: DUF4407 domain-containing protein [Methylomonas sp.]|nr:DUF4407 domain-containing protein [Methylomonas sp.]
MKPTQDVPKETKASPEPSWWTCIVAAFLCLPPSYAAQVPLRHWINHSRLVMFVFLVVLPLSGLSWAHVVGLLIGPREYALPITIVAGLFMMGMVGLMDSMLCGALGQRHFSAATFAVFCFRWVFALCAATSLAGGAVLFIMGDQLDRQRANEALTTQETDRQRIRQIHDLDNQEKAVSDAKSGVAQALLSRDTVPQAVVSLKSSYEVCQTQLKSLEDDNSRRLPTLEGARVKLRSEIERTNVADENASRLLPELKGKLHEVESEIGQFRRRISLKAGECHRFNERATVALTEHKAAASRAIEKARVREQDTVKEATTANTAAATQLNELNSATKQAWSKNLSAQVKAAWSMICNEWWAKFIALITFIICLVTELSPMLGKVALHGGALDQLAAFDEECARQRLLTQMEAVLHREAAERSVLPDNLMEVAEITAIRKAAEAVYSNVEQLQGSRERMHTHPDAKDLVDTVFRTARDKMRDRYMKGTRPGY